jgi:hypothetical protein
VGDARHGARRDPLGRLCLHATRLAFRHPETGAPVAFDSAPPAAFAEIGKSAPRRATPAPVAPAGGARPTGRREGPAPASPRAPSAPAWRPARSRRPRAPARPPR